MVIASRHELIVLARNVLEKFIAGSFEFIFVSTQDWFVKSNSAAISGGRRGFVGASVGGRPCRTPAALQRFLTRA
jgi:hypothetical protein